MSNLTSNLKQWGAQGTAYPDGYSYLEGEQPVDEWDNFLTYNLVGEIHDLQEVVNDRLESDSGGSHPDDPEVGHLSLRTDGPGDSDHDEELFYHDSSAAEFHRLLTADGPVLEGNLDVNGYTLVDDGEEITLGGSEGWRFVDDNDLPFVELDTDRLSLNGNEITDVDYLWLDNRGIIKQDGAKIRLDSGDHSGAGGVEIYDSRLHRRTALFQNSLNYIEFYKPLSMEDYALKNVARVEASAYNEPVNDISNPGSSHTFDLSKSSWFEVTLTDDVTFSIEVPTVNDPQDGFSFTVYLEQDSTGGHTITWPDSVVWPGGNTPNPPADDGNLELTFTSPDGGETWRGHESGRNFA